MTSARETEARIRTGWRPTIADKIRLTPTAEELDAFCAALHERGHQWTTEEMTALRDARAMLGGRPR